MHIEIIATAELSAAQSEALSELHDAVYPPEVLSAIPEAVYSWASPQWSLLLWQGEQLVTHVGIVTRDVRYNGAQKRIGGIGGVMTHPDFQGKGLAGTAMQEAAVYLQEELAVPFALLFCRPELAHFYGRLGWDPFTGQLLVEQSTGRIEFSAQGPKVRGICEAAPMDGELDLQGLPW